MKQRAKKITMKKQHKGSRRGFLKKSALAGLGASGMWWGVTNKGAGAADAKPGKKKSFSLFLINPPLKTEVLTLCLISTLCANIIFFALQFSCLMFLFFHTFPTCDFLGGICSNYNI